MRVANVRELQRNAEERLHRSYLPVVTVVVEFPFWSVVVVVVVVFPSLSVVLVVVRVEPLPAAGSCHVAVVRPSGVLVIVFVPPPGRSSIVVGSFTTLGTGLYFVIFPTKYRERNSLT